MRWARFDHNGTALYGVVEGDMIIPVRGSPLGTWERTGARHKLADVKLLVPLEPLTFYACGLNYPEHVREVAAKLGQEPKFPPQPDIGYRANNALIAQDEPIVIPKDATDKVQYEGELVAVIGRKCKHLTRDGALTAVLGYTIGNDVSERTWMIEFHTNHMIFGVVDFLVAMTRYLTLYPGDMVWMGTEGATADLKHGDVCEIEISSIGTLRNPVVREA